MPRHGKNYRKVAEKVGEAPVDLAAGIKLAKECSFA